MPTQLNKITKILLIASIAIFLFGSGYRIGEYRTQSEISQNFNKSFDFALFNETKKLLESKYVDKSKLNAEKMFYGSIKGMVASVDDPYTFFLSPKENQQSKDDLGGKFEGIGAQLGLKDNRIVVIAPLKKSPAERAGIHAGDIILKVDDQATEKWTIFEAVSKIRGKKGTTVKLTLNRAGKEIEITIVRGEIKVDSVELEMDGRVAILKLVRFGDDTNSKWDSAMEIISQDFAKGKIDSMVLDMRDNPGGYLQSAVYIAEDFLPVGRLVVKQQYTDNSAEKYIVERPGRALKIPVVVLINEGSASASEIVAGALRDWNRAKLVGKKTFGKGSIQEALDLSRGAGLHVTVAKWILPKGEWINSKGVKPDIEVENKIEEGNSLTREEDAQLNRAIEELRK